MSPRGTNDSYNEKSHLIIEAPSNESSDDGSSTWSRVSAEISEQMATALPTLQSMVRLEEITNNQTLSLNLYFT